MQVDLKEQFVFPEEVVATSFWPDMLLVSKSTKVILRMELTVPQVDRLDISRQLKKAQYQDLIDDALPNSWHALHFPIEEGCRGILATSVFYFLQKVGLTPKEVKKTWCRCGFVSQDPTAGKLLQVKAKGSKRRWSWDTCWWCRRVS